MLTGPIHAPMRNGIHAFHPADYSRMAHEHCWISVIRFMENGPQLGDRTPRMIRCFVEQCVQPKYFLIWMVMS